jgi:2',3'-cyclic-nucleotide 2'-phosphodiesterase (5'-nucleotidase family)
MISAIRHENAGPVLLVDGGDTIHGSGVASLSRGAAITPLLDKLGYDLLVPGNWEVVYGKETMIAELGRLTARPICANMWHEGPSRRPIFPPFHLFELGDLKVGFIGFNDPSTGTRQSPAYSQGIRYTQPEESLAGHVKTLRQARGCDLVFVLSHLGLTQQLDLASHPAARGVDYILGGDTHERVREPLAGRFAQVTEPGAFGSFLGRLDLTVEGGRIREARYQLLDVDPAHWGEDAEMTAMVAAAKAPYRAELERVIGRTTTPLYRYFIIETPLDNLITDALMWRFQTDFVVSQGFRFCPPLVPGPSGVAEITRDFLWSMLPVDAVVKTGRVRGVQVLSWLEQELENVFATEADRRFGGRLVRFKGMELRFRVGAPTGRRVESVTIGGRPIERGKEYSMVACEREGDPNDVLCRFRGVQSPRRLDVHLHDVMIGYLAAHSPVAPVVEGRAVAVDQPASLLSQAYGTNYRFR